MNLAKRIELGYTIRGEPTSLEEFLSINDFCAETVDALRALEPGDRYRFGGGAEPIFEFRRIAVFPIATRDDGDMKDEVEYASDEYVAKLRDLKDMFEDPEYAGILTNDTREKIMGVFRRESRLVWHVRFLRKNLQSSSLVDSVDALVEHIRWRMSQSTHVIGSESDVSVPDDALPRDGAPEHERNRILSLQSTNRILDEKLDKLDRKLKAVKKAARRDAEMLEDARRQIDGLKNRPSNEVVKSLMPESDLKAPVLALLKAEPVPRHLVDPIADVGEVAMDLGWLEAVAVPEVPDKPFTMGKGWKIFRNSDTKKIGDASEGNRVCGLFAEVQRSADISFPIRLEAGIDEESDHLTMVLGGKTATLTSDECENMAGLLMEYVTSRK